jgi:hypothetical protein
VHSHDLSPSSRTILIALGLIAELLTRLLHLIRTCEGSWTEAASRRWNRSRESVGVLPLPSPRWSAQAGGLTSSVYVGRGNHMTSFARFPASVRSVRTPPADEPAVDVLLDVDREYRAKIGTDQLRTIAPKRFNPKGEAWLPILHTTRGKWHFTALFSNTARAHELVKCAIGL